MKLKSIAASLLALCVGAVFFAGCSGSDPYEKYASAYNKVSAGGGMDANISGSVSMDGDTKTYEGNFKLDTSGSNTILYYEMDTNGDKITQFSDGEYLYTDNGDGQKTKYKLGSKPASNKDKEGRKDGESSGFNTSAFLQEFSGFLEAGKIRDLGLMNAIEKSLVTKTEVSGNTYTLTVADSMVKRVLNILVENETGKSSSEALQIDELNNFKYQATVKDDVVEDVKYSGTVVVKVPASLMASGEEATYDLDFTINVDFQNPGKSVTVSLPDVGGYEEVQ